MNNEQSNELGRIVSGREVAAAGLIRSVSLDAPSLHAGSQPYQPEIVDDQTSLTWQERGTCMQTDPEAFFPEKGGNSRAAKSVCVGCEVRSDCLDYALTNDEQFGIWGGMTVLERRKLKKRNK